LGIASDVHQPGITQHLEMAGHARLVHADALDQVVHRALGLANRVKDSPPRRFSDHVEDVKWSRH
jgi:hypothetical protein